MFMLSKAGGNAFPRRRRDIILKQIIKAGALLCALTMLEWNAAAVAEEKRLGDYIYVPAMSDPRSVGTISLRVDGVRCGENGEKETVEALSGAEFGVYVYSSEGRLTPWANPLYPSEPMRIRGVEGQMFENGILLMQDGVVKVAPVTAVLVGIGLFAISGFPPLARAQARP